MFHYSQRARSNHSTPRLRTQCLIFKTKDLWSPWGFLFQNHILGIGLALYLILTGIQAQAAQPLCTPALEESLQVQSHAAKKTSKRHSIFFANSQELQLKTLTQFVLESADEIRAETANPKKSIHLILVHDEKQWANLVEYFGQMRAKRQIVSMGVLDFATEQTYPKNAPRYEYQKFETLAGMGAISSSWPLVLVSTPHQLREFFDAYPSSGRIDQFRKTQYASPLLRFIDRIGSVSFVFNSRSSGTGNSLVDSLLKVIEENSVAPILKIHSEPPPTGRTFDGASINGISESTLEDEAEVIESPPIRTKKVDEFQDWVRKSTPDFLRENILLVTHSFKRWFLRFMKTYPGNFKTGTNGWWVYFDNDVLIKIAQTEKVALPRPVLLRLGLAKPRYSPEASRKMNFDKIRDFENWVLTATKDDLAANILSARGPFKRWFSDFRNFHPGTELSGKPGWWTYFSTAALVRIYDTGKVKLPQEVLEQLGLNPKTLNIERGPILDIEKVQLFQKWVLESGFSEVQRKLTSRTYWFKSWFSRFRANHPGTIESGRQGWWSYFKDEALIKMYATGKIVLPKIELNRLKLQPHSASTKNR